MAKRELSSTLKNLKFMQRAVQKEEKIKEEEKPKPDGSFGGSAAITRRCIVIMEGNPHPGALKGRMSFQSFNPSIDKLHEEAANIHQMQASNVNQQNGRFHRVDETSATRPEDSDVASPGSGSDKDLKRKQPEMEMEAPSPQSQKNANGDGKGQSSSLNYAKGSSNSKQQKREKRDWNVLRPPKAQTRRS